jgi:hypothetical protein
MWFYRGSRKPVAHWFDPAATISLCKQLKPGKSGVAWRHPIHDQHVPQCRHCKSKLRERKTSPDPSLPTGVKDEGGIGT